MSASNTPFFSVIVPAYNARATVARCVESVLAQTFADWELIVVDDGSTDGTADVARSAAGGDARVTVVSQANAGPAAARNHGLEIASARYICRLDADDEYLPGYLEVFAGEVADHPEFDIYTCNGIKAFPDGRRECMLVGRAWKHAREIRLREMLLGNRVLSMSVYDRRLLSRAGGGSTPGAYVEDLELWMRALLGGSRIWYFPDTLAVYYVSDTQMSADGTRMTRGVVAILKSTIASGRLPAAERRVAIRALRYWSAAVERNEFENALAAGTYQGARRAYLRSMRAYRRPALRFAGLALVLISPRLFARMALGTGRR